MIEKYLRSEPLPMSRLSIHDSPSTPKNMPSGQSPDSVLDPSMSNSPVRSMSPDYTCTPDRTDHDREVLRNSLKTINSDAFRFLQDGTIVGPGRSSGFVRNFDDVSQYTSGRDYLHITSAQWGSLIRPVEQMKNRRTFSWLRHYVASAPNRKYFDDDIRANKPLPPVDLEAMGWLRDYRPDIALHGTVDYPSLGRPKEGPGGTSDWEQVSLTKRFIVRVPLEYALKRAKRVVRRQPQVVE